MVTRSESTTLTLFNIVPQHQGEDYQTWRSGSQTLDGHQVRKYYLNPIWHSQGEDYQTWRIGG
jgi:hypothetical protein